MHKCNYNSRKIKVRLDTLFFGTETVLKAEAEAKGFRAQAVCLGALPNQTKKSEQLACQINNSMEMLYIAELCHICLNSNLNINGAFLLFGQKQLQWIKITLKDP